MEQEQKGNLGNNTALQQKALVERLNDNPDFREIQKKAEEKLIALINEVMLKSTNSQDAWDKIQKYRGMREIHTIPSAMHEGASKVVASI